MTEQRQEKNLSTDSPNSFQCKRWAKLKPGGWTNPCPSHPDFPPRCQGFMYLGHHLLSQKAGSEKEQQGFKLILRYDILILLAQVQLHPQIFLFEFLIHSNMLMGCRQTFLHVYTMCNDWVNFIDISLQENKISLCCRHSKYSAYYLDIFY